MNRILGLLLVLGVAGGVIHLYKGHDAVRQQEQTAAAAMVAPDRNLIDVYGRPGCAYTSRMISDLERAGVPIRFHNIDYPHTQAAFQDRFANSGLVTSRGYALPVIAVAGQELARPSADSVIYRYNSR